MSRTNNSIKGNMNFSVAVEHSTYLQRKKFVYIHFECVCRSCLFISLLLLSQKLKQKQKIVPSETDKDIFKWFYMNCIDQVQMVVNATISMKHCTALFSGSFSVRFLSHAVLLPHSH